MQSARFQIAERIRGLIGGQDANLSETALRLGIDELPLRISVDPDSPYPTVDVIAAVVRAYGVDPTWLLTGDYDVNTHRKTLATDTAELPAAINVLMDRAGAMDSFAARVPPQLS